ncbi:MAG: hypothetical protein H0U74_08475 [Bradymonadaceae bacterium]|nr:hypothetical protein [Lujinxingiaceae bacterium]
MKTHKRTDGKKSFWTELLMWALASTLSSTLVVGGVYLTSSMLEWGMTLRTFALLGAALLSLTWGSWASLIWTENRALRVVMEALTIVPGILILAMGLLGLYIGWGSWYLWAGLLVPSAGTIAAALLLSNDTVMRMKTTPGSLKYLLGFTLFPAATALSAAAIAYLWWGFVTRPVESDWRSLLNVASFMVSVLSIALVTTVIPAMVSRTCRQLAASWRNRSL